MGSWWNPRDRCSDRRAIVQKRLATTRSQLLEVVSRHLSRIHAESLVRRAVGDAIDADDTISPDAMGMVVRKLSNAARLFLPAGENQAFSRDLRALVGEIGVSKPAPSGSNGKAEPVRAVIAVSKEQDIVVARSRARELCMSVRANPASVQKAATIVSELARNIVSYTPGGELRMVLYPDKGTLSLESIDRGTGIPNLSLVMSGNYASRTGLGMGLLGSKRLADAFDIQTGPGGTRILAEVQLR